MGEEADRLGHRGLKRPAVDGVCHAVGGEDLTEGEEGAEDAVEVSATAHQSWLYWSVVAYLRLNIRSCEPSPHRWFDGFQ